MVSCFSFSFSISKPSSRILNYADHTYYSSRKQNGEFKSKCGGQELIFLDNPAF